MMNEGPESVYPIQPIATRLGENEDFDKFVRKLCDEIDKVVEFRKEEIEPIWEDCEANYWATGEPDATSRTESQLDFTITFEKCKQASANLSNPIAAQDTVFVAKARPGFPSIAATHDILLDWIADRSDYDAFIDDAIRHAQIYPKCTAKIPYVRKVRKIRFWDVGPDGKRFENSREEVVFEGNKPYVLDPRRLYHPIPCADIDEAPWWAEKLDMRVADIRKKVEEGYYRADLNPLAVGDSAMRPEEDEDKIELYIAHKIDNQQKDRSESTVLHPLEVYTTYEGNECVIIVDLERKTWLAAHDPFYQEFPRSYATFCWHQVAGSLDGVSMVFVLDQLHRAYVAIVNILLDAGVRSIEPLMVALKDLGLSQMLQDGRIGPGLLEVDKLVIDKLGDAIHEIQLTSGEVTFLLTMLERIERHMHDASNIPLAFSGHELAERPTATGTTSVMEKAMQPLYALMTRFRRFLIRIIEIQYSQYRQFYPESLRIFVDAQSPQESQMLQAMLVEFPPGYWRDQVILETKVNSQTMSKAVKKQEALALVDKWPQISESILSLGEAASSGTPISPIAGNALDVLVLLLQEWLTEFELPEVRDVLDVQGSVVAGQAIAEAVSRYETIIQQLNQRAIDLEAKVVDLGGETGESNPAGPGQEPAGSPEATA